MFNADFNLLNDYNQSKSDDWKNMNKDRALIFLGMSSRTRIKITDLSEEIITEYFRIKKSKLEKTIRKLSVKLEKSFIEKEKLLLELKLNQSKEEFEQIKCAYKYLITAKRAETLSRDLSWKPGMMFSRQESKWLIIFTPKGKSISVINQTLKKTKKDS